MEYKILLNTNNSNGMYFTFYQDSSSAGDWSSTDKEETINKISELLEEYSLSEIKLVIAVDITTTIDIPALPTSSDAEQIE